VVESPRLAAICCLVAMAFAGTLLAEETAAGTVASWSFLMLGFAYLE
jgi:hypothetical protein